MKIARLIGPSWVTASVVLTGVVLAGCGSGGTTASGKLELAAAGGGANAAGSMAMAAAPQMQALLPTSYVLDGALPNLGSSATTWRLTPHPLSASDVRRFAATLGLSGAVTHTPTGWQVTGADSSLNFFTDDGTVDVSYSFGEPGFAPGSTGSGSSAVGTTLGIAVGPSASGGGSAVGGGGSEGSVTSGVANPSDGATPVPVAPIPTPVLDPNPPSSLAPSSLPPVDPSVAPPVAPPVDEPNAAQAQRIARALLDRLGVLAGQQWSADVTNGGGVTVACSAGTPCAPIVAQVAARSVTFSLVLNGMDVSGIDWSVTVGAHGQIESLDGEWATPTSAGSYPLRTTATAFAQLRKGDATYLDPQPAIGYAVPAVSGVAVGAGTSSSGSASSGAGSSGTVTSGIASPATLGAPSPATLGAPSPASNVVHITGVSLGLARWDAVLDGSSAVDLVPIYRFHAAASDAGVGASGYDIDVLALSPSAISFTTATNPPETNPPGANPPGPPQPEPAQPAPPSDSTSSSWAPPASTGAIPVPSSTSS